MQTEEQRESKQPAVYRTISWNVCHYNFFRFFVVAVVVLFKSHFSCGVTIKHCASLSIFFLAPRPWMDHSPLFSLSHTIFWIVLRFMFFHSWPTLSSHFLLYRSIFRYIAVTQPIKYAKHKNSLRIFVTILLVWAISIAIGSPIVLGLNNTPNRVPDLCAFFNTNFIIFSSLVSFYIPCIIMVFLYWSIFKVSVTSINKQQWAK